MRFRSVFRVSGSKTKSPFLLSRSETKRSLSQLSTNYERLCLSFDCFNYFTFSLSPSFEATVVVQLFENLNYLTGLLLVSHLILMELFYVDELQLEALHKL